jgi:Ca2+-binding EF-hand superfamily protein
MDTKGAAMMRKQCRESLDHASKVERGEINFDGFEALVSKVQEKYERILCERKKSIMEEELLSEADVAAHSDELVSLYDSFLRGNLNESSGIELGELRLLLIEYGLYPRSTMAQDLVAEIFEECDQDSDGTVVFSEFLSLIRQMRELYKISNAADHKRMFDHHDRDGSGNLVTAEISSLLSELGLTPRCREDQQDLRRIIASSDPDGSGTLDFEEFQNLAQRISESINAAQRRHERQTAAKLEYKDAQVAELRDAFYALDAEGNSILTIDKLRRALDLLRIEMPSQKLQAIAKRLDVDSVGGLNFEQFLHFMKEVTGSKVRA